MGRPRLTQREREPQQTPDLFEDGLETNLTKNNNMLVRTANQVQPKLAKNVKVK